MAFLVCFSVNNVQANEEFSEVEKNQIMSNFDVLGIDIATQEDLIKKL